MHQRMGLPFAIGLCWGSKGQLVPHYPMNLHGHMLWKLRDSIADMQGSFQASFLASSTAWATASPKHPLLDKPIPNLQVFAAP